MKFLLPLVGLMMAAPAISGGPVYGHIKHGHGHGHHHHHGKTHKHYHTHFKTGVTHIHKHKHGHAHGHHGIKHYHVVPSWLFRVTIH